MQILVHVFLMFLYKRVCDGTFTRRTLSQFIISDVVVLDTEYQRLSNNVYRNRHTASFIA